MPAAKRDVSPIGTSKFERPYEPTSTTTSAATSPTSATVPHYVPFHYPKHSLASTTRTTATYSTTPTSIDTLECDLKGICGPVGVLPEEPDDDWSQRFRSMSDLGLEDAGDLVPDRATLAAVQDLPVYDADGNSRTFGSLYDPEIATHERQLIIFVRYFYCPACTAYIKAITQGIPMQEYFSIPIPTSITIIGCGQPDLIPHYKTFTGCRFQMFADPTRLLFKKLGMGISLNIGKLKPAYMEKGLLGASKEELGILKKSLKEPQGLKPRDLLRGGHPMQVGGEFMFENGEVVWCHRMKNYRNHAEIGVLRKLLGMDG